MKWLRRVDANELFLSAVTIGEVERGIYQQQRINPEFSRDLRVLLETILRRYQSRILPLSVDIARRWGQLSAKLGHCNADLMIAATALEHDLIVVTRNTRHFEPTQVAWINPYG